MLIDPGHGGSDPGAVYGGLCEKNLALSYALNIGKFAEKDGRNVRYTRTDDRALGLTDRSRIVKPGEILISCHINSAGTTRANGASVWYHGGDEESYKLAVEVFKCIMATRLFRKYGDGVISDLTRYNRGFAMLRNAAEIGARAAILLEPGFLPNAADRAVLTNPSKRIILADAVNDGLCNYLALKKNV